MAKNENGLSLLVWLVLGLVLGAAVMAVFIWGFGPGTPSVTYVIEAPAAAEVLTAEQPEADTGSAEAAECPQAADLGPWAPSAPGVGETFEVTANETVSAGVHVQLWWPGGSGQAWGTQEISVFLPPGLSIEVQDGAGHGWEYVLSCSMEEIQSQMDADHERRTGDTNYYGVVDVDALLATGLVVERFDRRSQ